MRTNSTTEGASLIVQPTFLIGTYNEDESPNFAPITWICASWNTDHYLFVINMDGEKQTKRNVARTGLLSANLVSRDMLALLDYFGANTGLDGPKTDMAYGWSDGEIVHAPTLDASRFVYELQVEQTIPICDTTTMYLCAPRNVQHIEADHPDSLLPYDPVIYSGLANGGYHSLKEYLGKIGDYYTKP